MKRLGRDEPIISQNKHRVKAWPTPQRQDEAGFTSEWRTADADRADFTSHINLGQIADKLPSHFVRASVNWVCLRHPWEKEWEQ